MEIGYQGDLKISKDNVKVQWPNRDQRKLKKNKHGAVIADCSAESETVLGLTIEV